MEKEHVKVKKTEIKKAIENMDKISSKIIDEDAELLKELSLH